MDEEGERQEEDVKVKIGKLESGRDSYVAGRDVILNRNMTEEYEEFLDGSEMPVRDMPLSFFENIADHPDYEVDDVVHLWQSWGAAMMIISGIFPRGMYAIPTHALEIYFALCEEMEKIGKGGMLEGKRHDTIMRMKSRVKLRKAASRIIRESWGFLLYLVIPVGIAIWYIRRTPWLNEIAVELWNSTG